MHALVTGATRGIGRRTALALSDAGLDVAITGRTVREGDGRVAARVAGDGEEVAVPGSLETTAREIEERGRRCLPIVMDLRSTESVTSAARSVLDTWGAPSVLVNNAIVHEPQRLVLDHDAALLEATWVGNFVHQLLLVQALVPAMLEAGGGLVVDVASSSAVHDPPGPPGEGGWVSPTPRPRRRSAGSPGRSTPSTPTRAWSRSTWTRVSWSPRRAWPAAATTR